MLIDDGDISTQKGTDHMDVSVHSPANSVSEDAGASTQNRFRYQHLYTSLLAIQMHDGTCPL
jgi:hypothetical protein